MADESLPIETVVDDVALPSTPSSSPVLSSSSSDPIDSIDPIDAKLDQILAKLDGFEQRLESKIADRVSLRMTAVRAHIQTRLDGLVDRVMVKVHDASEKVDGALEAVLDKSVSAIDVEIDKGVAVIDEGVNKVEKSFDQIEEKLGKCCVVM